MPRVDLCVVIAARNEERHLAAQLDSLVAQVWSGDWEILVVDNGSTDGTVSIAEAFSAQHPRLRVLVATERADKAYAVSAGLAGTTADAVVICDADDVVTSGWLAAMAGGLALHPVVTGPNELDVLNPPWLAASRGRADEQPVGSFAGLFPSVRGNNFGVRRAVWEQIGLLSADFYPCEDMEFSLRCQMNGIEVVGLPEAAVHYRYRSGAHQLWRQGFGYGSHRPRIARMLVDAGRPRPARLGGWKSWVMLIVTLPTVVTRPGRARWLWIAGNRFGQVAGSIRYRTLML